MSLWAKMFEKSYFRQRRGEARANADRQLDGHDLYDVKEIKEDRAKTC